MGLPGMISRQAMAVTCLLVAVHMVAAYAAAASSGTAVESSVAGTGDVLDLTVAVDAATPLRVTGSRYLSFNIDASGLLRFPFSDLGGRSYLRVGGTQADTLYYDMEGSGEATPPPGYKATVPRATIDDLCGFAADAGLKVVFGINAGRGPRNNTSGPWDPSNAKSLLEYVHSAHPDCVYGWELGNEPNLWIQFLLFVSPKQLVDDFRTLRGVIDQINPAWQLIGNDCAWNIPYLGEFFPVFTDWMKAGAGQVVDIVTWHWYPLESSRCPLGGWPVEATPMQGISPGVLSRNQGEREIVLQYAHKYGRNTTRVWLGETALASCGGTDNVTNAWTGVFYYLDKLGNLAVHGHDAVMRQSLYSSHYGLISDDPSTLGRANPDYWSAYLWQRLVDPRVLSTTLTPFVIPSASTFRAFAHCTLTAKSAGNTSVAMFPGAVGGVTVLVLNVSPTAALNVTLPSLAHSARYEFVGASATAEAGASELTVLTSHRVRLNGGAPLAVNSDGTAPPLTPRKVPAGQPLSLPPLSYAFMVFYEARAAACSA